MLGFLKLLIAPVAGIFETAQKRKLLKQEGEYKLARGEQVSKAEWEAMGVQAGQNSWKDEYITIVVTVPIPAIFIGNFVAAFSPENGALILAANESSLKQLGALMDTPYGQLVFAVALAAVGLKTVKGMFK